MTKQKIKNIIIEILKNNDIKKASFFGSYLRDDFTEKSDIDILIEFNDENKSLLDLIDLKQQIEKKLKKQIDLLTYNSINPKLKEHILANQERII